jgi:putative RNA 2'-phosphotransferase
MRQNLFTTLLLLQVLFAVALLAQEPPVDELLERAVYAEEAKGDLTAAIALYARVVAERGVERSIAAHALLRIGMCHLKSGQRDDARAAFERLVKGYSEQRAIIARIPDTGRRVWIPKIEEDARVRSVRTSKFLSLVLRHDPAAAGIELDQSGWASIDALLTGAALRGFRIEREELEAIVRKDQFKRFGVSEDGKRIRANFGHSVPVDLGLRPVSPPEVLYHGTMQQYLQAIMMSGLQRGEQQFVHLSEGLETAACFGMTEGSRRSIVLQVAAVRMEAAGKRFYRTGNGVWLTEAVPPEYLSLVPEEQVPVLSPACRDASHR